MARKRHSAEQIVNKLREAEVHLSQGLSVKQMCRQIGVTDQTYYKWRREYGGLKTWLRRVGVKTLYIEPGSPWENGYVESFNGKLRDELLDRERFDTLHEARVLIERWRHHSNTVRPHSALGYRPPAPETIAAEPCSATLRTPQQRRENRLLHC